MIKLSLEEQFEKWSKFEGVCKIDFSLSKLTSGLGFISNRPVSYNATLDTIAVDTNKLEIIDNVTIYLESKIKGRFITSVCREIDKYLVDFDSRNKSSKQIILSPFSMFHFKFLTEVPNNERKDKAHDFIKFTVENNFDNLNVRFHAKKSTACSVNIIETFKGFSDHDVIKYIYFLVYKLYFMIYCLVFYKI